MITDHRKEVARNVYETVQRWLEEAGPSSSAPLSGRDILTIPVVAPKPNYSSNPADTLGKTATELRFKRVNTMGGGRWAESMDKAGIRINYDPNWNTLLKIEELLELAKPTVNAG
jgi:hypothetical protein